MAQLTPQRISADVEKAKCNYFANRVALAEAKKWGVTCQQDDLVIDNDKLRRAIWLLESGCLTYDQECAVAKILNRMRLLEITCDVVEEKVCNALIPCSDISISVSENLECKIPKNSITGI